MSGSTVEEPGRTRARDSLPRGGAGLLIPLAVALMAGIVLGRVAPWLWAWAVLAAVGVVVAVRMARLGRWRGARFWVVTAVVPLGAGWWIVQQRYVPWTSIERYLGEESQLAEVVGRVSGPPRVASAPEGAFARFAYREPGTLFALEASSIVVAGQDEPVTGTLLVRLAPSSPPPTDGQRIRVRGWLSAIAGPRNPGEVDYRVVMRRWGIDGRLSVPGRRNWRFEPESQRGPPWAWRAVRAAIASRAMGSLTLGLEDQPRIAALLGRLLLGQRHEDLAELEEDFRRVGLAHLLAISGAHLGILTMLAWGAARLAIPYPSRAAMVVLAVLGLYLLAVPLRVPIVRAAVMAGCFLLAVAGGRIVRGLDLLAVAAILVLIWRPDDLFSPGFQLSFGVVAGLLCFTRGVSEWIFPPPAVEPARVHWPRYAGRRAADYAAVSLVAFAVAMPIVAYHFRFITPLAVLLSVLALLPLTAVLAIGYVKVFVGMVASPVSAVLAGPLAWVTDTLIGLVEHASSWPGSAVELARSPSPAWVIGAIALVVAVFSGWFLRRPVALSLGVMLVSGWLAVSQPSLTGRASRGPVEPGLTLHAFAVGDGSCYLLRTPGYALMFDCGSQAYLDVGRRSIVPALGELGVGWIDTLVISHADLDHLCGALDVVDAVRVDRVLVPPRLLVTAEQEPEGPTAVLVRGLRERGLPPVVTRRGDWFESGALRWQVLWPPADYEPRQVNDGSLVLRVEGSGGRVLLSGDIEADAKRRLLATGEDLRADVAELPHHGAFTEASLPWLDAVSPRLVIQSSGPAKLYRDPWPAHLQRRGIERWSTAEAGMVEARLLLSGDLRVSGFRAVRP